MLKRLLMILAVAACSAALPARAQNGANAPCPIPNDPVVLIDLIFPVVDANRDGGVALTEAQRFYPELTQDLFAIVDTDRNGKVAKHEIIVVLPLLPVDFLSYIDPNGDGIVQFSEVDEYVTQGQFGELDQDNNNIIDCRDFGGGPEGEPEGGPEGAPGPCPLPQDPLLLIEFLWPIVDADQSGSVSFAEVGNVMPGLTRDLFDIADGNRDGGVDFAEIQPFLPLLSADFLAYVDTDGDYVISAAEAGVYVGPATFALVDKNANGYIDCGDLGPNTGEGEGEGEGQVYVDPCALIWTYGPDAYPVYDTNNDGRLAFAELPPIFFFAQPVPSPEDAFAAADLDADGFVSAAEFEALKAQCGVVGEGEGEGEGEPIGVCDFSGLVVQGFESMDTDQDQVVTWDEFNQYISILLLPIDLAPIFYAADTNNDKEISRAEIEALVARCQGGEGEGEGEGGEEGEGEGEGQPEGEPNGEGADCQLLHLALSVFPLLDANHDQKITLDELYAYYGQLNFILPDGSTLFADIDANEDGAVSRDEIHLAIEEACQPGGGNEGEPPAEDLAALIYRQSVTGNGLYEPGASVVVTGEIAKRGQGEITAMGLSISLPEGWSVDEVLYGGAAHALPVVGATGMADFIWFNEPAFPVRLSFRVNVPESATGPQMFVGKLIFRVGEENSDRSVSVATPIGHGRGPEWCHDADRDLDWSISLSELLRLVQLYNIGGYHCADGTEDGFAPGDGLRGCLPHATDYLVQDWRIELSELLRLIQMYNSLTYYAEDATEDGYAPGAFTLE